ncbi:MAG: hypothetical protein ABSG02_05415 [Terriglobales bacterium]|jgi:hypothetical protein
MKTPWMGFGILLLCCIALVAPRNLSLSATDKVLTGSIAPPPLLSSAEVKLAQDCGAQAGASADVKYNAALSALRGKVGIVDCSDLTGKQTLAAPITVPTGVTLLTPSSGTWTCNFNNPAVSCIQVLNGGRIRGEANGVVGAFEIEPAQGSSMDSLVSSDLTKLPTSNGTYVEMSDFSVNYNGSGARIAHGLMHIVNLFDGSLISSIVVQSSQVGSSNSPAYGILVNGMCCGSSFNNVVVNSYNTNHNIPFAIVDSAHFGSATVGCLNCSFAHPGIGEPIVYINQSASPALDDSAINFYNLQGESNGTSDTTTALFQLINGNAKVYGGRFAHLLKSPTAYAFAISNAPVTNLDVRGFEYKAVNTSKKLNAVDNRITNETVKTDTDGNVPDYVNQPRYASALNQLASGQFAGVSACVSGTRAITLPAVYTSTPVILVFDETTAGGAKLIAKSATGFAVSCTGATDIFDWMVVGNPN